MMLFAGHVGVALIIAYLLRINPLLTVIGAVIPDLDVLPFYLGMGFNKIHRKISHSFLVPVSIFLLSIPFPILLPIGIGVISHFITDLDHWGIPILYPFIKKEFSIIKVKHDDGNTYQSPGVVIKYWFSSRGWKFWLEWALLLIGVFLTLDYWLGLVISLVKID